MNLQSLTNWLSILAFLSIVIALIQFSKNANKNNKVKKIVAVIFGLAILTVSIVKNNKETRDKKVAAYEKITSDSTIQVTMKNLEITTSLLRKKIDTIGSLNSYVNKLDSMGVKRDQLTNTPIISKSFVNYINRVGTLIQN